MDFLAILESKGFSDINLVDETGFNSSPKTKGVLIRAKKPLDPYCKRPT
jgi:hypothetical protein